MLIQLQPNKKRTHVEIKIKFDRAELDDIAIHYAKDNDIDTDGYQSIATLIGSHLLNSFRTTKGNNLLIKILKPTEDTFSETAITQK